MSKCGMNTQFFEKGEYSCGSLKFPVIYIIQNVICQFGDLAWLGRSFEFGVVEVYGDFGGEGRGWDTFYY